MFTGDVRRGILEALAYSDIFEFPLRLDEIQRDLPLRASMEQVADAVQRLNGQIETSDDYFFLAGRRQLVDMRRAREQRSNSLLPTALKFGRSLGSLPFIRMVALTGSLAVMNVSKNADFDYMLVAVPGRVWTARAFALLLNRVARSSGWTLCPNLIVSETALEWPLHDLYSARELYQMIPITGKDVYQRLIQANAWAQELLPNRNHQFIREESEKGVSPAFGGLLELALRGEIGHRFENWEMTRKIARFSKQPGFGEETIFNAEVCQGNFHHHRTWTREAFEKKLLAFAAPAPFLNGEALTTTSPPTAMEAYKI